MINRTARRIDQRLSTLETTTDYLRPHRRADLAHRVRQPETVAPARRAPPDPMAALPARARRRPCRRPRSAAARGQDIELPGQRVEEDHRRASSEPSSARPARPSASTSNAAMLRCHRQAITIESMPGFGPILGASCSSRPATSAPTPTPATWPLQPAWCRSPTTPADDPATAQPRRYSRPLRHVCYLSAQTSMMRAGPNRAFYLKKRAGGHRPTPAVITLARRRIDVLLALNADREIEAPFINLFGVEVSTEVEATHARTSRRTSSPTAGRSYRTFTDGYLCPCAVIIPPRAPTQLQTSRHRNRG